MGPILDNDKAAIWRGPMLSSALQQLIHSTDWGNLDILFVDEAQDLSILLRSGALSAPMEIVEERTVGPSLGESNILAGKNSMYFGLLLVGLFLNALRSFSGAYFE